MANGEPSFSSYLLLVAISVGAVVALYASDAIPRRGGGPVAFAVDWPQGFALDPNAPPARRQPGNEPYGDQAPDQMAPPPEAQAEDPGLGPTQSMPDAAARYPNQAPNAYSTAPARDASQAHRLSEPQGYPAKPADREAEPPARDAHR